MVRSTSPMLEPGEVVAGKYRVERVLGRGGMGVVVSAIHLELDDRVAIKCVLPEAAQRGDTLARFLREAKAARQIQNEHAAKVSDVGRLPDGSPYIVMEYLEGIDLERLVDGHGPLPITTAVDYLLQACEALAEAHALGIVHRDLKPANLFLIHRRDGSPCIKILDFGISKVSNTKTEAGLTRTGGIMGSPLYMSPEQLRSSKDVDARSDIWSLGVILYQLLAHAYPFMADGLAELSLRIVMDPHTPLAERRPDVPPALGAVIDRCLSKRPDGRFASIAELAYALSPFASAAGHHSLARIYRYTQPWPDGGGANFQPNVTPAQQVLTPLPASPPTPLTATPTPFGSGTTASPVESHSAPEASTPPLARTKVVWIVAPVLLAMFVGGAALRWLFAGTGGATTTDKLPPTAESTTVAPKGEASQSAEPKSPSAATPLPSTPATSIGSVASEPPAAPPVDSPTERKPAPTTVDAGSPPAKAPPPRPPTAAPRPSSTPPAPPAPPSNHPAPRPRPVDDGFRPGDY